MAGDQIARARVFDLVWELYRLADYRAERKRLAVSGNPRDESELEELTSASFRDVIRLSAQLENELRKAGKGDFDKSINSLLRRLPIDVDEANEVALRSFADKFGDTTIDVLRQRIEVSPKNELNHIWDSAFVVGLATLAAAGVGAPLAALVTNEAIVEKVLEAAVSTFASVAAYEVGIEVKRRFDREPETPTAPDISPGDLWAALEDLWATDEHSQSLDEVGTDNSPRGLELSDPDDVQGPHNTGPWSL